MCKELSEITDYDASFVAILSKDDYDDGYVWGRKVIKSIFYWDSPSYKPSIILSIAEYLKNRGYDIKSGDSLQNS